MSTDVANWCHQSDKTIDSVCNRTQTDTTTHYAEVLNRMANRGHALFLTLVFSAGIAACSSGSAPSVPASAPQAKTFSAASATAAAPATAPVFHAFIAGVAKGLPANAAPLDMAPDGLDAMWFTDIATPAIGTIASDGTIREYSAGLAFNARPYSIVSGRSGTAWFTDRATASVGFISATGKIQEFTNGKLAGTTPAGLTITPDGTVWFLSVGPTSYLGHVSFDDRVTATALPSNLSPDGSLTSDSNGNLWFIALNQNGWAAVAERRVDGTIVRRATGLQAAFEPCCPNLAPKRLVFGPDGNLWFTMLDYYTSANNGADGIAVLGAAGMSFFNPSRGTIHYPTFPSGIATRNSRVWFTGDDPFQVNGGLWVMNVAGNSTAFPISFNPIDLATARNGTLWITAGGLGQAASIVEAIPQ